MLRKFKITIDGKEYLVEMEEIGGNSSQPTTLQSVAPTSAPAPVATEAASVQASQPVTDATAMVAPMPGAIIKILVAPGDQVKENQPLMVLEAMKMENEIVANQAGVVAAIYVTKNDTVNAGDALIRLS
ncbi:acetyl-CoA carboxylase biotin carboxyl carrier protein subunit [Lactobacillus sp. CBA3606]|uniref:acetyl-CoA carboxylase biotin carboxyl carrier protein subunit n=1 Tax=Lactobacillus sp. CBA3606 TaxID=2099789 RepID=UPI000CFE1D17|nr:acetyl-CoA carboxylase biotin carboxyl carrier protein subunit [Lactobacillus sp. CBA3606]AVK64356.1 acetyl-CoA carboxylase biotin carboxyl carrier protein subunit [Lactobacillus sp. CBA3606]